MGLTVGNEVGAQDGIAEGSKVGNDDGLKVGKGEGLPATYVGPADGTGVGLPGR